MGKSFAERRALRHGLSQEDLAKLAGVSQSLVSEYEKGKQILPEYREKIEQALRRASETSRNSSRTALTPTKNESAGHENESSVHTAGTMADSPPNPSAPHLTLITPARGTPAAGVAPEVEQALGLAFDGRKHRLTDTYAVLRITARLPLAGRSEKELVGVFKGYLDAAARLRERSAEITTEALLAELTFAQTK